MYTMLKARIRIQASAETGRKRVKEAACIRTQIVAKRIKIIGNADFSYHMTTKKCTLFKNLCRVQTGQPEKSKGESDVGYKLQPSKINTARAQHYHGPSVKPFII